MTGAELFVTCLEDAGIDVIFGIPGEENIAMMPALESSSIRFVLTRHEQAAAFMASVHGRLTGRPAGCLSTLGPGALNLVTGVADAALDHVPLLAITAQGSTPRSVLSESHQIVDLDAVFAPITRMTRTLTRPEMIAPAVAEAIRSATAARPGAVHLCLPEDVADGPAQGGPVPVPPKSLPLPDPHALLLAAEALRGADRPLIVAGVGVIRQAASEQLVHLAESLSIPVATSLAARGVIPEDHPFCLFAVGQPFEDHIDAALDSADLIVAIGFDPVEYPPAKLTRGGRTPVVHLGEIPAAADAGWHLGADVSGSLSGALKGLVAALGETRWEVAEPMKEVRRRMLADRETLEAGAKDGPPLAPRAILRTIGAQMQEADIVLSGVGLHKLRIARDLPVRRPGQIIVPNGLAGMGLALPGAIAAALTAPVGRVLAICGDGEFLMNLQEMETATRLDADITAMIWEDGGYGLIEAKQRDETGRRTDLAFRNPGWADLARAFGWGHHPVENVEELAAVLDRTRAAKGPQLVTLRVDYATGLDPA